MEDTLSEVFTQCWGKLLYGSLINDNAFHTGVLGTQGEGSIGMRTVVLRAVKPDEKQLVFYTDKRSSKMTDLTAVPFANWLFYDGSERVQVKLLGNTIIHHMDEVSQSHWQKVNGDARKLYMAVPAPSTSTDYPTDGLEHLNSGSNTEDAYLNFAVVITTVDFIEWLSLKKDGHRRAQFKLIDGSWKGQWIIP
ncbi:pyridoxamine 5'-phosphate oxidase family protein [Mucilaginibacter paludis]|uniref:Pyridoxamine 5'-phosphate oxidase-related FMN-binding protein n=1 Tax=Mucilaginibacter paludis DSM 18603 TaxID=714943 RepID=H1Y2V7_9SPHI|nr:pyridoxamine 5'-phosphate oxidase family protein [Mucilaginibacter paludis]EHQ28502.1 pyridoxamine 5'-phosphate oxidase-related FMN-binding protein [Mucilaginibacter paludis DSM 18603]